MNRTINWEDDMTGKFEAKVQMLMDVDAISKLKARYCRLADTAISGDSSKWDELLSLFADDVTADFEGLGIFEGIDSVGKVYKETIPSFLTFSSHMILNPIIDIDGERAKGSWYFFVPCTIAGANQAAWANGFYEDAFIKSNGIWKFKHLKSSYKFLTSYEEGWVKVRMYGE